MPSITQPAAKHSFNRSKIILIKDYIQQVIEKLRRDKNIQYFRYGFDHSYDGVKTRYALENAEIEAYLKYLAGDVEPLNELPLEDQVLIACVFDKIDILKSLIESSKDLLIPNQPRYISIAELHESTECATLLIQNLEPENPQALIRYLIDRDHEFMTTVFTTKLAYSIGYLNPKRVIDNLRWLQHECEGAHKPPKSCDPGKKYPLLKICYMQTKTALRKYNDPITQLNYLRYFYEKYIEHDETWDFESRFYFYAVSKPLLLEKQDITDAMKLDDEKDLQVLIFNYLYLNYHPLPIENGGITVTQDQKHAMRTWIQKHDTKLIQNAIDTVIPQLLSMGRPTPNKNHKYKGGFADINLKLSVNGTSLKHIDVVVCRRISTLADMIGDIADYSENRLILNHLYTAYCQFHDEFNNAANYRKNIISPDGTSLIKKLEGYKQQFEEQIKNAPDQVDDEVLLERYKELITRAVQMKNKTIDTNKMDAYIANTFDPKKPLHHYTTQEALANAFPEMLSQGAISHPFIQPAMHQPAVNQVHQPVAPQVHQLVPPPIPQAQPPNVLNDKKTQIVTGLTQERFSAILGHAIKPGDIDSNVYRKMLRSSLILSRLEQYIPIGLFNGDMSLATREFIFENLEVSLKSRRSNGVYWYPHHASGRGERIRYSTQMTMSAYYLLLNFEILFHKFQVENENQTGRWLPISNTHHLGHINIDLVTRIKSVSDLSRFANAAKEITKLTMHSKKQLAIPLNHSLPNYIADFSQSFNRFLLRLRNVTTVDTVLPVSLEPREFFTINQHSATLFKLELAENQNLPNSPGTYLNLVMQLFIFICFKEQTFNYPKPSIEDKSYVKPHEIEAINAYDHTLAALIDCYTALTSLTSVEEFLDEHAEHLLSDNWQAFYNLVLADNLHFTEAQLPRLEQAIQYANTCINASLNNDEMIVDDTSASPTNVQDAFYESYVNGDLVPIRMLGQKTLAQLDAQITLELGKYQDSSMYYPCTLIKDGIPIDSYASSAYPKDCQIGLIFQPYTAASSKSRDPYTMWFPNNGYSFALDGWNTANQTADEVMRHLQNNNALTVHKDPATISAKLSHSYSKFKGLFSHRSLREVISDYIDYCTLQDIDDISIDSFNNFLQSKHWEITQYSTIWFNNVLNRSSRTNNTITLKDFIKGYELTLKELGQQKDPSRKAAYTKPVKMLSHNELLLRGLDPLRAPQPDEQNSLLSRECGDVVGIILPPSHQLIAHCLPRLLEYLLSAGRRLDSLVFAYRHPESKRLFEYDMRMVLSMSYSLLHYCIELVDNASQEVNNNEAFQELVPTTAPMKFFTDNQALKRSVQDILAQGLGLQRRAGLEPNSQGKDSLFCAIAKLHNLNNPPEKQVNAQQLIMTCAAEFPEKYPTQGEELIKLTKPEVDKEIKYLVDQLDMTLYLTKINTQGDTVTATHFKITPNQPPTSVNANNLKMLDNVNPNANRIVEIDDTFFTTLKTKVVPQFGLAGRSVQPEPKGDSGKRHMGDDINAKRQCR